MQFELAGLVEGVKTSPTVIDGDQQPETAQIIDLASQSNGLPGELTPSKSMRFPRWAIFLVINGLLGMILLGKN
jgi:hypothetical protein